MRVLVAMCAFLLGSFLGTSLGTSLTSAEEQHKHALSAEEVGSIHFVTSCAKGVESDFNRAVALLHSFQYEQAREGFAEIAKRDPQCGMAQWGVAMTHYHRSEEHTSELQSQSNLVCRLLLEKKNA